MKVFLTPTYSSHHQFFCVLYLLLLKKPCAFHLHSCYARFWRCISDTASCPPCSVTSFSGSFGQSPVHLLLPPFALFPFPGEGQRGCLLILCLSNLASFFRLRIAREGKQVKI